MTEDSTPLATESAVHEQKTIAQHRAEKLMNYLRKRRDERGIMADLRCALVESKRHRASPYLGHLGGIGDKSSERVIQTVAGLYATHPLESQDGNFGSMCRRLISEDEREKLATADGVGPISRRFQHLLAADGDEVFDRVVRFVLRAKAEEVPVNYLELYESLYSWQWSDQARTRWAQSFWAPVTDEEDEA